MDKIETFSDMKLYEHTTNALKEMGFVNPTKVQIKTIPICLKDRDVVVQAKTGSGKTLAFLIPLVEKLALMKCGLSCGIQAVILLPTADLAIQIVDVLSKLIKYYPGIRYLSVIGGKSHTGKKDEWSKINDANILISTLGRFLEHLEKNATVDMSNVKYLIIDETDYMLEETFFEEMEAILKFLPSTRATWLFSATQSSIVDELGRLALKTPIYIGVDEKSLTVPKNLSQCFMKIELQDKIQALWNLLEAQHRSNVIVFFSTQKQVLFFHRLFSCLNPPYKIVQLRKNMRLDKRVKSMEQFLTSKGGCVLFATDIASRGLDFPRVTLVVQYDLPRELDYYVHRAGRTARFNSKGTSVLMVMSSEIGFLALLKEKGLILKKISNNIVASHKKAVAERASMKYASDLELFNIAKAAFLAYLRDYAKRPPRLHAEQNSTDIFVVAKLPVKLFSKSMGFKTIPDEESTMALVAPRSLADDVIDDRPFLIVKKNVAAATKRNLDLTLDDASDSENDMNDEIDQEDDDNVMPAFNFDDEFEKLKKSSAADRKYFISHIKPKYKAKKRKESKEDEEMDCDDEEHECE